MASAKQKMKKIIVDRKRDGSMADIYVGATNTLGKFEDMMIPLNKEVMVDENLIKSLKARQESVRVKVGKSGENLVLKPVYSIEVV